MLSTLQKKLLWADEKNICCQPGKLLLHARVQPHHLTVHPLVQGRDLSVDLGVQVGHVLLQTLGQRDLLLLHRRLDMNGVNLEILRVASFNGIAATLYLQLASIEIPPSPQFGQFCNIAHPASCTKIILEYVMIALFHLYLSSTSSPCPVKKSGIRFN